MAQPAKIGKREDKLPLERAIRALEDVYARSDIVVPKDGNQCGGSLFLWKAGKREKSNGKRNSTSEANNGAGHA